jgi:hypothetical protein
MSADDAMQHLFHFCAVLPIDDYVDNRPMLSFEDDTSGRVRGIVTLPNSVLSRGWFGCDEKEQEQII